MFVRMNERTGRGTPSPEGRPEWCSPKYARVAPCDAQLVPTLRRCAFATDPAGTCLFGFVVRSPVTRVGLAATAQVWPRCDIHGVARSDTARRAGVQWHNAEWSQAKRSGAKRTALTHVRVTAVIPAKLPAQNRVAADWSTFMVRRIVRSYASKVVKIVAAYGATRITLAPLPR